MDFPNSELWNYTTQLWMLPDVKKTCKELQNNFDININMLLYCCWLGDKGLHINEDDLQVLLDTLQQWQTVIQPLRDSRKMMKKNLMIMPKELVEQTKKNISEMELNAAHITQLTLEKTLKLKKISACNDQSNIHCSLENIKAYLTSLEDISSNDEILSHVGKLLTAIYDDEETVQTALMCDV